MIKINKHFYLGRIPTNLLTSSRNKTNYLKTKLIKETLSTNFKYYCSLCLIIRDENEYLIEWLSWHINQGVEHFYIYDHGSKYPVKNFLFDNYPEYLDKITIINWSNKHKDAQVDAYNDCLNKTKYISRWLGFIDTDEQINVKNKSLLDFLKDYEDYAGVYSTWVTYGANNQIKQTNELLRKRFTEIKHINNLDKIGKSIVQPLYMKEMIIHNGCAEDGFILVDEHKNKIDNYALINENPTRDFIWVNHYYTKSYEEWIKKIKRGSGHAKFARRYGEFFKINPNMEFCRENLNIIQEYENFKK